MTSPTTRVLAVLALLQANGHLSGPDLAQRLGVDGRSLRRYIGKLQDQGIPVVAERGRYGSYSLMPGYKLPPLMFGDGEAVALAVGLLAARRLGLAATHTDIESAQAKLERVMPLSLQSQVRALSQTVALDVASAAVSASAPGVAVPNHENVLRLSAAAYAHQQVHLVYGVTPSQHTQRDVDPYGLAYRGGCWYLVGYCHLRQALRTFRLDRVHSVAVSPVRFTPPVDFDALHHIAHGVASLPRAFKVEVILKTNMATAQAAVLDTIGLFQPHARGVLMQVHADDLNWVARALAGLPFDFEIVSPAALGEAVQGLAKRLLAASLPAEL